MLFHDADPNDLFNPQLRREGLTAEEHGQGIAVWHGMDAFSGEDVEVMVNLDTKSGGLAMNGRVYPGRAMEKGEILVLALTDAARGQVDIDIDAETLAMNIERTGIEVFNDGQSAHLRLYDKLTKDDILTLDGDQFHEMVDQKVLDPKDYHGSAFKYAESVGAI